MIFTNVNDPTLLENKKAIKAWLVQYLNIENIDSINIDEKTCEDENCVHATTIIKTENKNFIIHKPLYFIRKHDIYELRNK